MRAAFDAIVIGSGAGGGAAAWRLASKGAKVLLLEAGPWFDPAKDYGLAQPDWELRNFPSKPGSQGRYTYGPLQALDPQWDDLRSWHHETGHLVQTGQRMVRGGYSHVRGVGGSTLHFTGEAHRLNPHSMRMRTDHGVAADWPFDYAELEPYYLEAEQLIGVAGPTEPGDRWRSAPYPQPAHPLCKASRQLGQGAAAMGMSWVANARAALSQAHDGRPPCNYCGACNRGCPRRDKGSVDQTFIPRALKTGRCELRARATVTTLLHDEGQVVRGVRYVDEQGRAHTERADLVVLCGGAIETPRLLLANRIGNAHVGRHFMETLFWTSIGLHPEPLSSYQGLPSDAISWDHNRPDAIPGVIGGARFYAATQEADCIGPVAYATRLTEGWGAGHKQRLRQSFGSALAVGAIGECLPNAGSFVELDPTERDANGLPLARIHSRLDDMALRRLRFMARTSRTLLESGGCTTLRQEFGSFDDFSTTHVFGTCRLGMSQSESVCDDRNRVHGWGNLLVCDGSAFPSSGGGESPSLTIQAMTLRAIDLHLAAV
jgi:choline dehydrogenase-like flavoprotein